MAFEFLDNILPSTEIANAADVQKTLICELSPAAYDGLIKIVTLLQDYGSIIITDSKITQSLAQATSILSCDISNIIGPNVNLHILSPKKYLKRFKAVKCSSTIKIFNDPAMQRYLIKDETTTIQLSKQIDEITLDNAMPELPNAKLIGNALVFQKEDIKSLLQFKNGMDDGKSVNIIIHNNQAVGLHIDDFGIKMFDLYKTISIDENDIELALKSYTFLMFDAESAEMYLALNDDGKYWLMLKLNIGFANISIYENVENAKTDQLLV